MKKILPIAFIFFASFCYGQNKRYLITIRDKQNSEHQIQNPSGFLSPKAIARRARYGIAIDSTDLPVSKPYLDSIRAAGAVKILNTSRWLNMVLIETTDPVALQKISAFPFVTSNSAIARRISRNKSFEEPVDDPDYFHRYPGYRQRIAAIPLNYGNAFGQVHIHEGEYLHELGLRGEGMLIAMLDAGFMGYQTNRAFDSLRLNNQIADTWDFVRSEISVNEDHPHGLWCLSIMAGNLPGQLVGTAPAAKYYLFRTEDAASEYPVEEQNWAAAAERADSLGIDLITSSLGYTIFDKSSYNHTYQDLDGDKTIITRAADLAAKKGIIVTNSAGNDGTSPWKYLAAPSDGDSVLAIGAVNVDGVAADFSSYGPSADGRVKPDVASVGWNTFFININGTISQGNGTSFANPNLAGLIVCLWQAFPEFNNMEILDAVKKSAHQFSNPDDRVGYGIPDMKKAYDILLKEKQRRNSAAILGNSFIKAFPIPFTGQLTILYRPEQSGVVSFELFDNTGRKYGVQSRTGVSGEIIYLDMKDLVRLPHGVYYIRYIEGKKNGVLPILK